MSNARQFKAAPYISRQYFNPAESSQCSLQLPFTELLELLQLTCPANSRLKSGWRSREGNAVGYDERLPVHTANTSSIRSAYAQCGSFLALAWHSFDFVIVRLTV